MTPEDPIHAASTCKQAADWHRKLAQEKAEDATLFNCHRAIANQYDQMAERYKAIGNGQHR